MVKKKVWKGLLPIALILLVSAGIGVTGATVLHTMKLENPIRSSGVEGEVQEDLDNGAKIVSIKNTGEADALVRAAYSQTWIYKVPNSGEKIILPNVVNGEAVATPKYVSDITKVDADSNDYNTDYWELDSATGWYYYKSVLPGTIAQSSELSGVSEPLISAVYFNPDILEADQRYKGAKYELHVTMEMVQAGDSESVSRDAAEALFKKSFDVDGAVSANGDWNGNKYSCTITWNNDLGTPSDTETESNTIQEEP